MRRLLVVEHDADAPAGLLGGWAAGRGLSVQTVRLHAGDGFPAHGRWDGVAVLGSERTAYDAAVPWLAAELSFLERLLPGPAPVLGICFGAQVLARVLGARLYRLAGPEIGWASAASTCRGLAAGPWVSWHRDAFGLPPGATELAANDCSLQAFAAGPHVGVQFHPEATRPIVASWVAGAQAPPAPAAVAALLGPAAGPAWQRAAAHAGALFDAWFSGGLAG